MTHISGWAFASPETRIEYRDDFLEALKILEVKPPKVMEDGGLNYGPCLVGISKHRTRIGDGYGRTTYRLSEECKQLTARQRLLIADCGNACFGGTVEGLIVNVYTD